jgi:hypothetical protein
MSDDLLKLAVEAPMRLSGPRVLRPDSPCRSRGSDRPPGNCGLKRDVAPPANDSGVKVWAARLVQRAYAAAARGPGHQTEMPARPTGYTAQSPQGTGSIQPKAPDRSAVPSRDDSRACV